MCRVGGRIPTGGFPNIVLNFLKAARDPETASPGAGNPGARRAGEPGQSLPIPATPRLRVGGNSGLEGGWAGAAGCAESAEIENPCHSGRIEAKRLQTLLGNSPALQPQPGRSRADWVWQFGGSRAFRALSGEEGAGKANSSECDPTPPGPSVARDCPRARERAELGSAPPSEPTSRPLRSQRFSGLGRKRHTASKPGKLRVLRAGQGGGADSPRCFWQDWVPLGIRRVLI